MEKYHIRPTPESVLLADEQAFDEAWAYSVSQCGVNLDLEAIRAYGRWFVGREVGWRCSQHTAWDAPKRRLRPEDVAAHLLGRSPTPSSAYALHSRCKLGRVGDRGFYWTRVVAVDLDASEDHTTSLEERYRTCTRVLGPCVVLSSPRGGLHLYWPLRAPMSVFGLTCHGPRSLPVLMVDLLRGEGLEVRSGNVEVFPTDGNTLRLPLAADTHQLDGEYLVALPLSTRREQLLHLIATIGFLAASCPVDPEQLVARVRVPPARPMCAMAVSSSSNPTQGHPPSPLPHPAAKLDLDRLEREGLYRSDSRHDAAMALARRWMLVDGLDVEDAVEALMTWTETKHNGLSEDAKRMTKRSVRDEMEAEYRRICVGIDQAINRGELKPAYSRRNRRRVHRTISAPDTHRIFAATGSIGSTRARYGQEVFLFALLGYATDCGTAITPPGQDQATVEVQLSSRVLQALPRCSDGRYKAWLQWAEDHGFARMVRNYRHSIDASRSRCRTYRVDLSGPMAQPAAEISPRLLLRAATASRGRFKSRVHPRQIEHALVAQATWGEGAAERYGALAAKRIRALVDAYHEQEALAPSRISLAP